MKIYSENIWNDMYWLIKINQKLTGRTLYTYSFVSNDYVNPFNEKEAHDALVRKYNNEIYGELL